MDVANSDDLAAKLCKENDASAIQISSWWLHPLQGSVLQSPPPVKPDKSLNIPHRVSTFSKAMLGTNEHGHGVIGKWLPIPQNGQWFAEYA